MVGPSGAGKNAIMKCLIERDPHLERLPTATTRPPRDDEREGIDHFFVTREKFADMEANGELIESEAVHSTDMYGTVRRATYDRLQRGAVLMADIDVHGAADVHAELPHNTVRIFVAPPSLAVLRERILARKPDIPPEELERRLDRAAYEMSRKGECEFQVVNDELQTAVTEVEGIIDRTTRARGILSSAR
jgi:guanylate kinase